MRKIACTLLVFLVALFAADRLGSMAMEWVFRHSNDVLSPKLRHLADGVDEDVVLLGFRSIIIATSLLRMKR